MANTSSAKKKIRVDERKTKINKRRKDSYKSARKELKKAVESKNTKNVPNLLGKAYKAIDKAAKNNIIHKKTASRYKSSLGKLVATIKG